MDRVTGDPLIIVLQINKMSFKTCPPCFTSDGKNWTCREGSNIKYYTCEKGMRPVPNGPEDNKCSSHKCVLVKGTELTSGLSMKLTYPYTELSCHHHGGQPSSVAHLCWQKGYPRSTPQRLVFNDNTY